MSSNNQKGIIQLGIISVIILAGALFAGAKLVNNPDLTFFNISEEAKGVEEANCGGCVDGKELRWVRNQKKGTGRCIQRVSLKCNRILPIPTSKSIPVPTNIPTAECGPCFADSDCEKGLTCLLTAQVCPEGTLCTQVINAGSCIKPDGSSGYTCGWGGTPMPSPTPPFGCYYQEVQCFKAPCNPILVCPTPTPPPPQPLWNAPGTCSCFGKSYLLCAPSEGRDANVAVRCQNGCYVDNETAGCYKEPSGLYAGELCAGDHQCETGKCAEPSLKPNNINLPDGFRYVCQ